MLMGAKIIALTMTVSGKRVKAVVLFAYGKPVVITSILIKINAFWPSRSILIV
jgi:hypothetical protein